MRISVRAILPYKDNELILIHRVKEKDGIKKEYYVFPGGGLEENETHEQCISREIKEELGINIKPKQKLYDINNIGKREIFYLCEYIGGDIGSGVGPEFTSQEYSNRGTYKAKVISFDNLSNIKLYPEEIRDKWLNDYKKYI